MTHEPFWKTDPRVLIEPRYLHRFFPSGNLTLSERLNAIVRMGAYIGVGLAIVQREMSWVLLPIVAAVITMAWGGTEEAFQGTLPKHERDLKFLASEIVSGNTRDTEHRHRVKRSKPRSRNKARNRPPVVPKRVFQDLDTNMDMLRNERATLTSSLDTGISDAPGFAREMMRRDEKRKHRNKSSRV